MIPKADNRSLDLPAMGSMGLALWKRFPYPAMEEVSRRRIRTQGGLYGKIIRENI